MSRGIHAGSHRALEASLPVGSKVVVRVYMDSALSKRDYSIDRNMYFDAERKDVPIRAIMHVAKRCAVNCQLDYVRPADRESDYSVARYEPAEPWASIGRDDSTFCLRMYMRQSGIT